MTAPARYFISQDGTAIDFDRIVVAHWYEHRRWFRKNTTTFCIWFHANPDEEPFEYHDEEAGEIANALAAYWRAKPITEPYR